MRGGSEGRVEGSRAGRVEGGPEALGNCERVKNEMVMRFSSIFNKKIVIKMAITPTGGKNGDNTP